MLGAVIASGVVIGVAVILAGHNRRMRARADGAAAPRRDRPWTEAPTPQQRAHGIVSIEHVPSAPTPPMFVRVSVGDIPFRIGDRDAAGRVFLRHGVAPWAVYFGIERGNPWVNVYAPSRRRGEGAGSFSGPHHCFGFSLAEQRWSYAEGPPGAREIRAWVNQIPVEFR